MLLDRDANPFGRGHRWHYVGEVPVQNPYEPVSVALMQEARKASPSGLIPRVVLLPAAFTLAAVLNEAGVFWGGVGFTYWYHLAFFPLSVLLWGLLAVLEFLLGMATDSAFRCNTSTQYSLSKTALGFAVVPPLMLFLSLKLRSGHDAEQYSSNFGNES